MTQGGGPQTYPNNWIFRFFNPVLNDLGRFRTIFRSSADFREISRIFWKSLIFSTHFLHFGGIWLFPGDPSWKKLPGDALRSRFGAMRVQISHKTMVLNQTKNNGFAHPASRKARVTSGLDPCHVLRKQAIFSPAKTCTLEKWHATLSKLK